MLVPYNVSTGALTLAASATATASVVITFPTTGDFICNRLTGQVLQSSVIVQTWGGTLSISADGKLPWTSQAIVPWAALVGDAKTPFQLDPEVVIKAGSTLTVSVLNNVATATICYLVFVGNMEIA